MALPEEPDRQGHPIYVDARRFTAYRDGPAEARDNVQLERADQYLRTEVLKYDPVSRVLTLPVPLLYRDARIELQGEQGKYGFLTESGWFAEVDYRFVGATARGSASHVRVENRTRSFLSTPEFTTCPGEDPEWLLSAREVEFRHDEGIGIARHAKLEFMDIPVLYAPYFSFPIDDRRKSGFLYPDASVANDNGLEIGIPYYWNIAPNQDATITPRFFTDRGLMLTGEYRLLTRRTRSALAFDYLHRDKVTRETRYQVKAGYTALFSRSWRGRININRASDEKYFQDFGSSLRQTARPFLRSTASISGSGRYWTLQLLADDFQVIDESVGDNRLPYRRIPRILFETQRAFGPAGMEVSLDSEAVYFDREVGVTGARVDLYPRLGWSLERYWGFLRSSAGYRYTAYSLELPGSLADETPDRGLPIVSLDGGMFFEREQDGGLIQTLEHPRIHLRLQSVVSYQPVHRRRPAIQRQPGDPRCHHAFHGSRDRPGALEPRARPDFLL
jgi:LPS-assembly protein